MTVTMATTITMHRPDLCNNIPTVFFLLTVTVKKNLHRYNGGSGDGRACVPFFLLMKTQFLPFYYLSHSLFDLCLFRKGKKFAIESFLVIEKMRNN
jgi:hypothetical protein